MHPYQLSKTSLLAHLQCPKYGYMYIHERELANYSESEERLFESGHEVNDYARATRPGGLLIDWEQSGNDMVMKTRKALSDYLPAVFEGAFIHDEVMIRADILEPAAKGHRLVEVKASTSVKPVHIRDAAIQKWIIERSDIAVSEVRLMHINNEFVYQGDNNYTGLFTEEDISGEVNILQDQVPGWIAAAKATLAGDKPDIEIGPHCSVPYGCPFYDHCTENWPDYPVYTLPYGGKQVNVWIQQGYRDIREVPREQLTSDKHKLIRSVLDSGEPFIGREARQFVKQLRYPRYYLDFETVAFTVPYFVGTRPYEAIPFQWSCHVERKNGNVDHYEALFVDGEFPARRVAESLIEKLGRKGPILVYSGYERTTLNRLIERYPEYTNDLNAIIKRLVDLLPLTRANYYHSEQHGSWSMKQIIPTIAPELSYDNLEGVRHGDDAQYAFKQLIGNDLNDSEKVILKQQMLEYCARDTIGLLEIVRFFSRK